LKASQCLGEAEPPVEAVAQRCFLVPPGCWLESATHSWKTEVCTWWLATSVGATLSTSRSRPHS
jgi:hypothetical protein